MAYKSDDNLDKRYIPRQVSGRGKYQDDAAGFGPCTTTRGNSLPSISSPSEHHARSGPRKKEKKAAALFLGRDSCGPDKRLWAIPTAVSLSPWERTVRVTRRPVVPRHSLGGRRGLIVKFTRASQRRLIRKLYSISGLCQHVVLTYPGTFPCRGDKAKTHLQAFCRWVKRFGIGGIWVMEFQDRGAPHFHLLLNGWLSEADARRQWLKIIGAPSGFSSSCALRVEPIYDQHRIISYVAKALSKKVPDGFSAIGNFYGVFGPWPESRQWTALAKRGYPT